MTKTLKFFLIVICSLFIIWVVGRITNTLQFFSVPSSANYPTLKPGDRFFASNLKTPKRFDFICYYSTTPEYGKIIVVHRLCGLEGEEIEIRNGDIYINNKPVDQGLPLTYTYRLSIADMNKLAETEDIDPLLLQVISRDSAMGSIPRDMITSHSINARRIILNKNEKNEYIESKYSKPWNADNFGPIIVPKGKYFVLGDNRLGSQDSRYTGFVDKKDYVATALIK